MKISEVNCQALRVESVEEIGARLWNHCYTSPITVAAHLVSESR